MSEMLVVNRAEKIKSSMGTSGGGEMFVIWGLVKPIHPLNILPSP